jgi:hypothetical protein
LAFSDKGVIMSFFEDPPAPKRTRPRISESPTVPEPVVDLSPSEAEEYFNPPADALQRFPILRHVTRGRFNEPGMRRYRLTQRWAFGPFLCWVMMNPSVANDERDDPTTIKCRQFSMRWGYGGMILVNVASHVATDPRDLLKVEDPIGQDNPSYLVTAACHCERVVFAYGQPPGEKLKEAGLKAAEYILKGTNRKGYILRLSKDGIPEHPLYLPFNLELQPWDPFEDSSRLKRKRILATQTT